MRKRRNTPTYIEVDEAVIDDNSRLSAGEMRAVIFDFLKK